MLILFIRLIGAWLIHPFLILFGKVLVDSIPNMTPSYSWTIVNIGYVLVSYILLLLRDADELTNSPLPDFFHHVPSRHWYPFRDIVSCLKTCVIKLGV